MELVSAKRECTGRGQLDRDWQATVRIAASSLRRIPYYGMVFTISSVIIRATVLRLD